MFSELLLTQQHLMNEAVHSNEDIYSNKSFDFLLNPIYIVVVLLSYSVLLCILVIYYANKIKLKMRKEPLVPIA